MTGNLAANKFVVGIVGPEGDIGLALRQIELSVARYKFNSKLGMAGLEALDGADLVMRPMIGSGQVTRIKSVRSRASSLIVDPPFEVGHRGFDELGAG